MSFAKALHPNPAVKRPARALVFDDLVYVPKDPPSRFMVGPGTWLKDEGDLRVSCHRGVEIVVAPLDDAQIVFPPPETWVRRTRYHHILENDAMNPGDMLKIGHEVEDALPDLLREGPDAWQSLDIDYEPPRVKRLWRPWKDYRVNLHQIFPCAQALYHPHPWPSFVRIITGYYEMGIGHSTAIPFQNIMECDKEVARVVLGPGAQYEMLNPHGWHYVKPLREPSLSLMVTARPWDPPVFSHDQFGKAADLKPLDPEDKAALLNVFTEGYTLGVRMLHWAHNSR